MEGVPDLVFSSAYTRPDQRIWAQVTLDVGRDDLSRNAIAWHKPLVCARRRHFDRRAMGRKVGVREGKKTLKSVSGEGQIMRAEIGQGGVHGSKTRNNQHGWQ